jgi:PAS domain S-box-containing protein
MLMSKDINCANFRGLLEYLHKHHGTESVSRATAGLVGNPKYLIADKENPTRHVPVRIEHLSDPANWVSNEFSLKLFANVHNIVGGKHPLFAAGEGAVLEQLSKSTLFIANVFGPKLMSRQVSKINARFNRTKTVKLVELGRNSATFNLYYYPKYRVTKDVCDWNRGIYSGIAKLSGAGFVTSVEKSCVVNGDPHCSFHITWKNPGILKRFFRWLFKHSIKELIDDYEMTVKDRDRLIDQLSESEKSHRALTDHSLTGIFIYQDDQFVYANERLLRILDCRAPDIIGRNLQSIVHPDFMEDDSAVGFEDSTGERSYREFEFVAIRKDRSPVWLQVLSNAIRYQGRAAVMGNVLDVSQKKESERALRYEKEKFRVLVEESPLGVALIDARGAYRYLNPKFTEIFGYTLADIPDGRHWFRRAFPDEDHRRKARQDWIDDLKECRVGESRPRTYEVCCKDGSLKIIHFRPVTMDSGDQFIIYEDITRQQNLEAQIKQASKMEAIGTLAGGIAHDFNNILSGILGYAELSLLDVADNPNLQDHMSKILEAGERAKDLVQQILTFSRQSTQELQPLQIKAVIREALKLIRASLPTTIEIRHNLQSDSAILSDPTQIHQVLMNLCSNAAHAMQETGGLLEINLHDTAVDPGTARKHLELKPGKYVKLSVSDSGCGIDPAARERIFDPFYTTKDRGKGTGMGLAVVHGIVKNHGGAIQVDSRPKAGSTFNLYLPAIESEQTPVVDIIEVLPTGNEKILFVDDEAFQIDLGVRMLEHLGYRVTSRKSSREAFDLFRSDPLGFDLVITDMTMPEMTGDVLAREMMKIRPDLPVVICTGYSERLDAAGARAAGIQEMAMKPLAIKDFAYMIRKVLDGNRKRPHAG